MLKNFLHFMCLGGVIFALNACETIEGLTGSSSRTLALPEHIKPLEKPRSPAYYKISEPIQCVPYAREKSGIQIFGNAHTWWKQAGRGGYKRTSKPHVGAVMVLSKTSRLKYGHLAVVTRIIDDRTVEVTHSNWGNSFETRRVVYNVMRVHDSSQDNDWSRARFWHYDSGTFGSSYSVSGFILPKGNVS